jgi:DNA-binding NarL/FixJ family response regulator
MLLLMLYGLMQDYGILTMDALPTAERRAFPVDKVEEEPDVEPAAEETVHDSERAQEELSEERIAKISQTWAAEYVLTGRECDVLCAILQNKKRKDIAAEMCVTEHTVKKHTGNIFSKLEVSSRSELFAKAEAEVQ